MYRILISYFDGQTRKEFENDLKEKNWVFVLFESGNGKICGFSTLKMLNVVVEHKTINALFSGDTIIDKNFWGKHDLFNKWMLFGLYLQQKSKTKLYWFLISKGYRTYRLLPKFFISFYPNRLNNINKREKKILNALAHIKFPKEYNPLTGIIHFDHDKQKLKGGVGEINDSNLKNPDVAFFAEKNPFHMQGDELACLAEIDINNLKLFQKIPIPKFFIKKYIKFFGWLSFRSLL
ncbi:MAG: hypothetical protein US74_C0017G0009 [Parcubacteria group bacterium GW2011_GWA2_38_13]|nr:MAG: hypothetical protein US74_C0017G0009 [Parcubacteria group bacterium GW2011_GWA2_38_13]